MKALWAKWNAAFAAMNQREKQIVTLALILGPLMLGFNFAIDPAMTKARTAKAANAKSSTEIATLQAQIAAMGGGTFDPDAANRERLAALTADVNLTESQLAAATGAVVPPERVRKLLDGLLARHKGLELVSLRSLPAEPLEAMQPAPADAASAAAKSVEATTATDKAAADKAARITRASGIYRHGIEIQVAGSYNDLLAWLEEVETRPERLLWTRLELSAENHPRTVLTLQVHSLSLDPEWMRL